MPRVKIKIERGNGLQQVVAVDTEATKGAVVGSDLLLNGAVATPAAMRQWLGVAAAGSGSSGGGGSVYPLTRTNGTNVTLTLTGSPAVALNAAVGISVGWAGLLAETRGGTGLGSYVVGDMLYADAANSLAALGIGGDGDVLRVSAGVPEWQAADTLADDPSVSIGLVAVDGVASTFMRSDAAPALDQGIEPVWTGDHQFDAQVGFNGTAPIAKPTVSGSRADPEAALANLLTALADYGLITNSTTA